MSEISMTAKILQLPIVVTLGAALIVGAALAFEHIGGYAPCPLCLQERYAYYFAVPAGLLAVRAIRAGAPGLAMILMALIALAFAINAGMGGYHSGVEWKWWAGPSTCSGGGFPSFSDATNLLAEMESAAVVRCDEASWRMFGLSFAGWNAVSSLALAILALVAALRLNKLR